MDAYLTPGKLRGLQQIADESGCFCMCAMDHRGSLEKTLCSGDDCYQPMVDFKIDLCTALASYASAVLLDPLYGAAQAVGQGVLPRNTGLLVSVEATGYDGGKTARLTTVLEGWGVEKIKRMGASAVKMLVYFRPDSVATARAQLDTVEKTALECLKFDIPFLVEPVSYALDGETAADYGRRKTDIVVATAEMMTALPIDVLKAEFPADMSLKSDENDLLEACRALDSASAKPWVILSAGADFPVFYRQVELACRAGASGFLGGRAIWQETTTMINREERRRFLETTAIKRLLELKDVVRRLGHPWYQKYGLEPNCLGDVRDGWYKSY
ncbi:Tagatose 16-diphosphate aldolase [Dehalogenimonas sp. WBC-2]|nr:Tagatose 16-diphosphate aldolase [Dehalogenimonas sp. WBC-2]